MNLYSIISKSCIKALLLANILTTCGVLSVIQEQTSDERDNNTEPDQTPANPKQTRWADSAFDYIQTMDCSKITFASVRECEFIRQLERPHVNVYLADPLPFDKHVTVVPGDDLESDLRHDAVLVVDPYPHANFGHLVVIFYIDLYVQKSWCLQDKGTILEGGECMTMAYKRRCRDVRTARKRNYSRRCKFNFIPLVYQENDYLHPQQQLTCRSNIPGFASCPQLRPVAQTEGIICRPTDSNPQHCVTASQHVHTSCRTMETCDQAVIISGGWNRWSERAHVKSSAWSMYHLVKRHGFTDRNVKVFYANGATGIPKDPESAASSMHEVYPAIYKTALRNHIQAVCSSPHCADSFLIYINGPSRSDGTTFLWDIDNDGVAADEEVYKLEELLGDIANCKGNIVQLIADQSYSGEIAKAVKRSKNHRNVAVYASSRESEYAHADTFTRHWTRYNHTATCMREIFKDARRDLTGSNPAHEQGPDVQNTNIFGAPCNAMPPFTFEELEADYLGCQNVPTITWLEQYYEASENSASSPLSSSSESSRRRKSRDASRRTLS